MISVVAASYQRGHYLDRSLEAFANQQLTVPAEYILVDDGSTDDTAAVVDKWSKHIDIKYIKLWKKEGLWRDCSTTINMGIRASKGDLVIATHPEVMPGRLSLQHMWDRKQAQTYLACKIYYLTPDNQDRIDTVPWRTEGLLAIRQLPDFYNRGSIFNDDYSHEAMDRHTEWNSWVFGGFTKSSWRWFGGLTEFTQWGSVDVDFLNRRYVLGIPTDTMGDPETICIHQNHDVPEKATDVTTPRDLNAAMAALPRYTSMDEARKSYI